MGLNVAKTIFDLFETQVEFNTIWVYWFLKFFFGVFVTFLLKYAKSIHFSLNHLHQTLLTPCP